MAKLRHLAIRVHDLEASARFYEEVFEMERVLERDNAIYLSDGLMDLAILSTSSVTPEARVGDLKHGIEHFGFQIDDFKTTETALAAAGATYAFDLGDPAGKNYERKWRGPEEVLFDISEKGWYVAQGEVTQPSESASSKE